MHTKQWQEVCGFVTDVCESAAGSGRTMRDLFDLITGTKGRVIYSWSENGRQAYVRRDDFRRSVISVARRLTEFLPEPHGIVGLHLGNDPFWPVCYWAILMSGHTPLILDERHELFHYRTLKECGGVYCITKEKNYPSVISLDFLKNSHSGVDSAFFDRLWEDRTLFVSEDSDGTMRAISHSGASVSEQLLRLRPVYQYNQSMFYPPQMGPARVYMEQPFSDFFGFLCGVILYPCFEYDVYISGLRGEADPAAGRTLSATHYCLSAEACARMTDAVVRQAERGFAKDAERYLAWLRGGERINDFRTLSRYMSISARLRKTVFGKKARCILCADSSLDGSTARFFQQLGIFFGRGYCVPELGLVSMELSEDPETRTGNSVGILLNGVVGVLTEDGQLVLDCGGNVGKLLTPDGEEALPSPFPIRHRAAFDQHSRLCILREDRGKEQAKEQADPELVRKIRELYAAVLNKPAEIIEEDMDFFSALGGDSLSYFLLLQHIEMMFGIQIKAEERIYFSTARYAAETLKPYIQNKGVVKHNA